MLRFPADENFKRAIVAGLVARLPDLDIIRAQDVGLSGAGDPDVLAWIASQDRILLTHDVNTMPECAYDRLRAGLPLPGVVIIPQTAPLGEVIENLALAIEAGLPGEWEGQVRFFPL